MTAPSLWGSGVQWGPAVTPGAEAYWGATVVVEGIPSIFVSIAGTLMTTLTAASWDTGRQGWFDVLSPCTASFTFNDIPAAEQNDPILVSTDTGMLWTGTIDSIVTTQNLDGSYTTAISATDPVGALGLARNGSSYYTYYGVYTGPPGTQVTADLIRYWFSTSGFGDVKVDIADSATALPYLYSNVKVDEMGFLDFLNLVERSCNCLMLYRPDGRFSVVVRDAIVDASVTVIDLSGADSPSAWTTARDRTNIINHWRLVGGASGGVVLDATDATSIDLYGEQAYEVSDYLCNTAAHFPTGMRTAMALPRKVVTNGTFPVTDLRQDVLHLQPLDWVSAAGDTWQVMSVRHDVTASPLSWQVSITADVSQNFMAGSADPTPDPPSPPVGTIRRTHTYTSTKSATVGNMGGSYQGNGAGDHLQVGYWSGNRFRSVIQFPVDWSDFTTGGHAFQRVVKATMTVRTTGQSGVAFGSSPNVYIRRIKDSWSEGSYGAGTNNFSAGNAVIWPGPNCTSSGQQHTYITTTENHDVDIAVTDIAQGWYDDPDGNHGLRIHSANEDSRTCTTEFYSDDSAHPPTISITCEVSA